MAGGEQFALAEEFQGIDFNSKRLEDRFVRTMETLSKHPEKSLWGACGNRAEAKAIYNMLGNKRFAIGEALLAHRKATVRRMAGHTVVLAVQDTTSLNYQGHAKMAGIGYTSEYARGEDIHTCLAVTAEGVVLGVLDQRYSNRPQPKDDSATHDGKKGRPIEDKESGRWLATMREALSGVDVPEGVRVIHVCDREGDMYELFNEAAEEGAQFLTRLVQNRKTTDNKLILDEARAMKAEGSVTVVIPRDTRRGLARREAELEIRFGRFEVKRPARLNKNASLLPFISANVIQVKEKSPPSGVEPIEWFLMTNEPVDSYEEAYEKAGYYLQRWKIETFHHALKSGCAVEKLQEHSMKNTTALVLMYSIVAVFIMNMTYIARVNPALPCSVLFDEEEWKVLYCAANRTKTPPCDPYTIADAVKYVSWLGGPRRAPSDGTPGVKTIWTGLQKLYTLLEYKELFDFVGQV
jgi:hypothetical protein